MRKKFTLLLASLLACVGVLKSATPTEEFKASAILPSLGVPEHQFYVRGTINELYWTSTTDDANSINNAGKFALYAVPGLQNCYYLYSIDAGKWLTYPNDNRDNRKDFVLTADNFDANAYWEITKTAHNGNACYQLRPTSLDKDYDGLTRIKNDRYANWFQGAGVNSSIGLWQQSPSDDAGSSWSFISVDVTGQLEVLLSQRLAVAHEILAEQVVYAKGEKFLNSDNVNEILSSPNSDRDEGKTFTTVVDGDPGTCWHSDWHSNAQYGGSHYVEVNLGENTPELLSFSYSRRSAADNDHTTRWAVYGVPAVDENIAEGSRDGLTLLAMISTPWGNKNEVFDNLPPFKTLGFKKFRIYSEATEQNRGYFHIGEFQLYANTIAESNEDRVKDLAAAIAIAEALETVTQADIDALNAKISLFILSDEDRQRGTDLLALTGVGYPSATSVARIALREAVESEATMLVDLNAAIADFKASTEITLPENGKAYQFAFIANDANLTSYNVIANSTTMSVSSTEVATIFYCVKFTNVDGQERYAFISPEGNFLGYHALTESYKTHVENVKRLQNDFVFASMVGVTSNVDNGTKEKRFGTVSMTVTNRILESPGNPGCLILKFSDSNLPFDKTTAPYFNANFTSAIKVTEVSNYEENNDVLAAASTIAPLTKGYIRVGEGIGKYVYAYGEDTGKNFSEFETLVNATTSVITDEDYSFVINMPAAGFYRIASQNSHLKTGNKGKYIQSSVVEGGLKLHNAEDANSIMYYNGTNILSYAEGLYINDYRGGEENVIGAVGSEPSEWTLVENRDVVGTYAMKNQKDGWFMSDWDSETRTTYGNNDANAAWIFKEVTSLPVVVGAAGYATLYAPVALVIPADVTAYTGSVVGNYLSLTTIEGDVIPANTGVIIEAAEGTYNFSITTTTETATSALIGTYAKSYISDDAYVLAKMNGEVGFYKAKKEHEDGTSFLNNGFKAYLPKPTGSNAAMYSFSRGEETSIDNLTFGDEDVVIYDLAGRRVEKMGKGIYIVNGKKMVVK